MEKDTDYYNSLAKIALNDDEAFIELYETFFPQLYSFIYAKIRNAADADEIAADVLHKVFMNLATYSGTSSFAAWLFSVANNSVIDFCRRKNKKRQIIADDWEEFFNEVASPAEEPENRLIAQEEQRKLLQALSNLTEREQSIIELKYWSECSNVEIAKILELKPSNVGIILFRALDKLKKFM